MPVHLSNCFRLLSRLQPARRMIVGLVCLLMTLPAKSLAAATEVEEEINQLTLTGAVLPTVGFVEEDANGEYSGYFIDLLEAIKEVAASPDIPNPAFRYNVTFNLVEIPTGESDQLRTFNGALDLITEGCETASSLGCVDFIASPYFVTPERTQRVTFPPFPFIVTFIVGYQLETSPYGSLTELIDDGGTVCLQEGTAVANTYAPFIPEESNVPCQSFLDCAESVSIGECDMAIDDLVFATIVSERFPGLEIVDIASDVGIDTAIINQGPGQYSFPFRSTLDPEVHQRMIGWMYDVDTNALFENSFGDTANDLRLAFEEQRAAFIEENGPVSIALRAGVKKGFPFIYQNDENNEWEGFFVDYAAILSNYSQGTLEIDFDYDNPLPFNYDAALDVLAADDSPYDIVVGDYFATPQRQTSATFPFRYLGTHISLLRLEATEIATIEEANAVGAPVCVYGKADKVDDFKATIENLVPCGPPFQACYDMLASGECDLFADDVLYGAIFSPFNLPNETVVTNGKDAAGVSFFHAWPMRSDLPASTYTTFNRLVLQAAEDGVIVDLVDRWLNPLIRPEFFVDDVDVTMDGDTMAMAGVEEEDGAMVESEKEDEIEMPPEDPGDSGEEDKGDTTSGGSCVDHSHFLASVAFALFSALATVLQ